MGCSGPIPTRRRAPARVGPDRGARSGPRGRGRRAAAGCRYRRRMTARRSGVGATGARSSSDRSPALRATRSPWPVWAPGASARNALARLAFREPAARALFAGMAAHSMLRLGAAERRVRARAGDARPCGRVAGGAGRHRSDRRGARGRGRLRGEFVTDHRVDSLAEVPPARAYLLDVTPRQVLAMAGERLPAAYRRRLEGYRYGPGVSKSIGRWPGRFPGKPRRAYSAGRFTWVARGGRSPRRSERYRTRPACRTALRPAWCSPAWSTRSARPTASTWHGRTATCPTAPRDDERADRAPRSSASRPASAT